MIDLLAATQIAGIASNAITILDKVYTQFVAFNQRRTTQEPVASPSLKIVNEPENHQIASHYVVRGNNEQCQVVTYKELSNRLDSQDLERVKLIEEALEIYEKQWNTIYRQIPLASGLHQAQLEGQLELVADKMGKEFRRLLNFLENRFQLQLQDHYNRVRDIVGPES